MRPVSRPYDMIFAFSCLNMMKICLQLFIYEMLLYRAKVLEVIQAILFLPVVLGMIYSLDNEMPILT